MVTETKGFAVASVDDGQLRIGLRGIVGILTALSIIGGTIVSVGAYINGLAVRNQILEKDRETTRSILEIREMARDNTKDIQSQGKNIDKLTATMDKFLQAVYGPVQK